MLRGGRMSVGVALSNDGVHWGRIEGEHSSGAALEPREGETFVGWPQVMWEGVRGVEGAGDMGDGMCGAGPQAFCCCREG